VKKENTIVNAKPYGGYIWFTGSDKLWWCVWFVLMSEQKMPFLMVA
jgi:hypothetical protein